MSGSLNKVMIIGNLGKDPEIRRFNDGNAIGRLAVATDESYIKKQTNEKVEATEWHNVVVRRGLADVVEKYLKKGDKVYVEGRLRTRSWDDNGQTKYSTEIHCDNLIMLGGKPEYRQSPSNPAEANEKNHNFDASKTEKDNLPF